MTYLLNMENYETGQLLGAAFLALIVVSALITAGRHGLGQTIRQSAIWGAIFIFTIACFGVWHDIQTQNRPLQTAFSDGGRIEVPMSRDGHYYLTLDVNGTPIEFVVDTGASEIVLTKSDADRAGLDVATLQFFGRANTANGEVRTAPVRLAEVRLGGVRDNNMPAFVNEGEMFQSLLGMSYLQRWDKLEISNRTLVLTRE